MKKSMASLLLILALLSGCSVTAQTEALPEADASIVFDGENIDITGDGVKIQESGDVEINGAGVYTISGSTTEGRVEVDLKDEGTVTLILSDLTLVCSDNEAILIRDTVEEVLVLLAGENTLTSGTEPVVTEASAEALEEDSEAEDPTGAALWAKCPLTLRGEGSLTVAGYINNGIASAVSLAVESGSYEVYAVNDALKSKGDLSITGGSFALTAEQDAVQAEGTLSVTGGEGSITTGVGSADADMNVSDSSMMGNMGGGMPGGGRRSRSSGEADSSASAEAVTEDSASEEIAEDSASEEISEESAASGEAAAESSASNRQRASAELTDMSTEELLSWASETFGMSEDELLSWAAETLGVSTEELESMSTEDILQQVSGEMRSLVSDELRDARDADNTDSGSHKGFKSASAIAVSGGSYTFDTEDDALHSDGTLVISGGSLTVASGDDGIHGTDSLLITDGSVDISYCYEGLEAKIIEISGGEVSIVATDDGMNANGSGGMFGGMRRASSEASGETDSTTDSEASEETESETRLCISGGTVNVDSGGDGLDSNGDLYITGGEVYVAGPSTSWDAAIDSGEGSTFAVTGGILMAAGYSSMAEQPESTDDTQGTIYYILDEYAADGETVTLTDASGNILLSHSFAHSFNCVELSSPALTLGETYTLTVGDESHEITMDTLNFSTRSSRGGMGGFGRASREVAAEASASAESAETE